MKRALAALIACLVLPATSAFAQQAFDTYVASTGADANSCLRTSPCATFTRAFAQTIGNGVIHVVDSGTYGRLTITHGITIDGGNVGTTLFAGGLGLNVSPATFLVNAGASDVVTIQNFTISGSGSTTVAIGVTAGGALHVQNCVFNGYANAAIDFRASNGVLDMKNVTITDVPSGTGVYVSNARAMLDDVGIHHTQTAVLAAGSATVTIRKSTANGNGTGFAAAYGPTAELHVDDCVMTNNQWAVVVSGGARGYVGRSTLNNNTITALFNDGSSFLVSFGNNQFSSNASDGAFTSTAAVK